MVTQVFKQVIEHNRQALIKRCVEMGEHFLSITHSMKGYQNQTHNLSSSKGYMVFDNGIKVAEGGFKQLSSLAKTGAKLGIATAVREVQKQGIALIIVAGERYSAAVEAKGRNVITAETLSIETRVQKLIDEMT